MMFTSCHESIQLSSSHLSRRRFLHTVSAASIAAGCLGFRDMISLQAQEMKRQNKAVIMLWMSGGPSQFETFDPKSNHANGGDTRSIATKIPGVQVASHWENVAGVMDEFALIRSLTNKEGNHRRASYQLHTGYLPSGSAKHPSLAANLASHLTHENSDLPSVVSIGRGFEAGAGYLDVSLDPFFVDSPGTPPANLSIPTADSRYQRRLGLLSQLETEMAGPGNQRLVEDHLRVYQKTATLVRSPQTEVFTLDSEPESLKSAYGHNNFGRGCLLARRLIEQGVPFVEVRTNGWDTHQDNFQKVPELASEIDPATAALIKDLKDRGMLDSTLVIWMGEFGRTPRINGRGGRDHFPTISNLLMAGAGIRGGQVIGKTSPDGEQITDRPVTVPDVFQSICHAVKIDPNIETVSPQGRPLKIIDTGSVITELFS